MIIDIKQMNEVKKIYNSIIYDFTYIKSLLILLCSEEKFPTTNLFYIIRNIKKETVKNITKSLDILSDL